MHGHADAGLGHERHAGQGITPRAVALVGDYCFATLRLHRLEIAIRPENAPSLRVVDKLGFRYEGRRPGYLHIDGQWRDHEVFALHAEECPEGLVRRLANRRATTVPVVSTAGMVGA